MSTDPGSSVRTVAVVGTGLIGASWAAAFLAHGLDVVASDPAEGAEQRLQDVVARITPDLRELGAEGEGRLSFVADAAEAVSGADLVQESAPENEALKVDLLADLDAAARPDVVIASSTSAFPLSRIVVHCARPERVIVAHPFNPPHLIPLVEIVGAAPDAEAVGCAAAFYRSIGKVPVVLKKEAIGHMVNRINSALWREALSLLQEGIAEAEDIDRAFRFGPGLRWAVMGPFATYHLGGGQGGIRHYMEHLQPAQQRRWADMQPPEMDDAFKQRIVDDVLAMAGDRSTTELEAERDAELRAILKAVAPLRGGADT
ncbi:MAG: 3-hydroxyacyl-CoA dehydrogenase NAD-binding domain-containing protein [Methyloligellaceae bacterium]